MGVIPFILSLVFISQISAFTITKKIIDKPIRFVNIDAVGNTYVVTGTGKSDNQLYKLNLSGEISSVTNAPYTVSEAEVSSRGDSYFQLRVPVAEYGKRPQPTLGIVRANSTKVEIIGEMEQGLFHFDKNDNFFFYKDQGVYLLRPNSSVPVAIKNLEDFHVNRRSVTDKLGNTYIRVYNSKGDKRLALVTKEAQQEENPQAIFVNGLISTDDISDLAVDNDNNIWITIERSNGSSVKKLTNGELKAVLPENGQEYKYLTESKGKRYFSAGHDSHCNIIYLTSNDEVVEVSDLKHLEAPCFRIHSLVNSEGLIYFYVARVFLTSSLGRMVMIKPDEFKLIPIAINETEDTIRSAGLDFNDDLWFVAGDMYHVKKGETVPELRSNSKEVHCYSPHVVINSVARKIYVSCYDKGLFMVENI